MSLASPCINVCRISPHSGWCEGCLRSLDEIARWGSASDDDKRAILDAIAERRQDLAPAGTNTEAEQ